MSFWTDAYDAALKTHHSAGALSFAEMAVAINREFNTDFSRNAAIGRANRLGLASDNERKPISKTRQPRLAPARDRQRAERIASRPTIVPFEEARLRCVEIDPLAISLMDLEPHHCRFPYGGDAPGEAITFCGHPAMSDKSWCVPHYHLCRGTGTTSERLATRGVAA
jgi:GcrA cell cycle regulator